MAGSDKKLQGFTAFNSGEYSKDLAGRTDLESFGSSTRYTSNMLSQVSGGLKKFYGTYHITEQTTISEDVVLVPFINKYEPMAFVVYKKVNNDATSLNIGLVHGDNYKDLDIKFPLTADPREIRWQQINDRIIFCHPSVQPFSIDFYGKDTDGEYVFDINNVGFVEVPYFSVGATNDYNGSLETSGITGEITIQIPVSASETKLNFPAILENQNEYTRYKEENIPGGTTVSLQTSTFNFYRVRNNTSTLLATGVVNQQSIERTSGSLSIMHHIKITDKINRERVLDVIKTVCPEAYIYQNQIVVPNLSNDLTGDKYYTEIITGALTYTGSGGTVTKWPSETFASTITETSGVVIDDELSESLIGRKIKFFFNDDTVISPWWQGKTVNIGNISYSNGHWYKATTSGTCGNVQPSHTYGCRSDGGVDWLYIHSGSNAATITSIVDSHTVKALVRTGELPSNTGNIYKNYAWSIWGKDGVHPSDIYMVSGRLGFVCNTKNYGSWNAMSVTDDYFNFSTEEYGEQLDTSAIVGLIGNNEASNINWVLAKTRLYMGGYSGEYYVNPGSSNRRNNVYTPTNTVTENISNMGGRPVRPLKYKELNMFVGNTGKELYTIAYDYTTDDYSPKMIGYLTQHIMERGIKRIEALNNLDRNIYLLHDTKQLSLFNYALEQKVMGFTELDFGDDVIDFVTTYANDEVAGYVITKRNAGKITIERLATKEPTYVFDERTQGDGTLADFVPDPHFANRTVWIKHGENFNQFLKVTLDENGDVSHDITTGVYLPQSKYFKIGLPMMSEVHTQPAFGQKVEGHQQQSLSVYMRMNGSGAFEYGASVDFGKYFKYEAWNLQQEYGASHRLYTGDIKLDIPLGYAEAQNQGEGKYPNTSGVGINIRSDNPEPLNLLSIQEIYI